MAQLHFFQAPLAFDIDECNEARLQLEKALALNGLINDKVVVTNFNYQGSTKIEDCNE